MRILVVDDHAMFAESLSVLLGSLHQVSIAPTGSDALQQITKECPCAILLDQDLPDIDGITLLKVIKALPSPPPVLLLTGSTDIRLIEDARAAGAVGILHKSMPPEKLINALVKIEKSESVWPENINADSSALKSDDTFNQQVATGLGITDRQLDVLRLLVQGSPNKTIARDLGIAESTVKTHIKSLFSLLKVKNRVACHNKALELGLFKNRDAVS